MWLYFIAHRRLTCGNILLYIENLLYIEDIHVAVFYYIWKTYCTLKTYMWHYFIVLFHDKFCWFCLHYQQQEMFTENKNENSFSWVLWPSMIQSCRWSKSGRSLREATWPSASSMRLSCIPGKVFCDFHQCWQILSYIPLSDPWDR